jgi:hypothetical protein
MIQDVPEKKVYMISVSGIIKELIETKYQFNND